MPARYNDLELHVVGKTTPNRKHAKDRVSSNRTIKRPPPLSITPVNAEFNLLTDDIDVIPATPSPVNHLPSFDDIDVISDTPPAIVATYKAGPNLTSVTIPYVGSLKRKSSACDLDTILLARAHARRDDLEKFLRAREAERVQDAHLAAQQALHSEDELASTENSLPRSETVPKEHVLSRFDSFIPESAPSSLPTSHLTHSCATNSSFHNVSDDVTFNQPVSQSINQSNTNDSPNIQSNDQSCNQSNNDVAVEPSMSESVRSEQNATFNATFEASIVDWSCDMSASGTLDASIRSVDMSFRSPVCDTPTRLSNSNSQFAYPTYTDSMARRNHHLPTLFPAMRHQLSTPQTQSQSSHHSSSFITPAKLSQLSNESVYGSPDLNQSRVSMGLIAPPPCLPSHMNEELRMFHDRMNAVFEAIKRSKRDKYWLTLLHYAIAALKIHARTEGLSANTQSLQRISGCTPAIVEFVKSFDLSTAFAQDDVPARSIAHVSDGEGFPIDPTPIIVVTPDDHQMPTAPQQESVLQHDQLHLSLSLPVSEASASSLTQSLNPDREVNNFIYPSVMSLEVAQSA